MERKIGVIILAAGTSARMGRSKQSLSFKNQTLLQRMAGTAASLNCGPVIIVLGANSNIFNQDYANAISVINHNWPEGMGSSICCGLKKLMEVLPYAEGAIITVCDQPYVTVSLLQKMIDTHQRNLLPIIACSYGDTVGTPVFFHHSLFLELLQVKGDKGAKQIVSKDRKRVELIDFPLGTVDIDTEEDYIRLLQKENDDCR
jgi:molybdenum cofactor cytidylyltransferase